MKFGLAIPTLINDGSFFEKEIEEEVEKIGSDMNSSGVGTNATGSDAEEGVDKDEMFSGLGVDANTSLPKTPLPIKCKADRFCDRGETFIDIEEDKIGVGICEGSNLAAASSAANNCSFPPLPPPPSPLCSPLLSVCVPFDSARFGLTF